MASSIEELASKYVLIVYDGPTFDETVQLTDEQFLQQYTATQKRVVAAERVKTKMNITFGKKATDEAIKNATKIFKMLGG